jgi:tetratricopeptide (TPR) repeat protein
MELTPALHNKIEELSEGGNALLENGDWQAAVAKWNQALDLVPEPKSDWEAATWLYGSIGDAYFEGHDLDSAKEAFFDALNCPGGTENPFIHYRLGQILVELGESERGINELLQAYMIDGEDIFSGDDDGGGYLQLLRDAKLI